MHIYIPIHGKGGGGGRSGGGGVAILLAVVSGGLGVRKAEGSLTPPNKYYKNQKMTLHITTPSKHIA